MKKFLFLTLLAFPFIVNAMKIETDKIDEFTGNREVITSWEAFAKMEIHIRFHLINGKQYMDFKYISGEGTVVGEGDKLLFKSSNGNITDFESIALYHANIGEGSVNLVGAKNFGIYVRYSGDIAWFCDNIATLMRFNSVGKYSDFKISEKEGYKLQDLANLFIATIEGNEALKPVSYNLQYLKKKKSARQWDLVKEDKDRRLNKEQLKEIVEEWESQTNEATEYKVSIKKAK